MVPGWIMLFFGNDAAGDRAGKVRNGDNRTLHIVLLSEKPAKNLTTRAPRGSPPLALIGELWLRRKLQIVTADDCKMLAGAWAEPGLSRTCFSRIRPCSK